MHAHGPALHGDGTATFRLWAPHAERVAIELDGEPSELEAAERGWWRARLPTQDGARYGLRLDNGPLRPDPASRRQPDGVHERSAVVDPSTWSWTDAGWRAPPLEAAVISELHVGTFTPEGTLDAATSKLAHLHDVGVTHVELLPMNTFNGPRGWGYDGVGWYAVHEPYGGPHALAAFVDACHAHGLAVLIDAVYNHLGPSGNYLSEFGPYLTERYHTPWGDALNLDGPGSDAVRAFILGSALAWLTDYHADGLRLDAVHALVDASSVHLLAELADATADLSGGLGRPLQLIAESDRQDPQTVRPREVGGLGLDAQWADELHHSIHVAVTGEQEGYYADYAGPPDVAAAYARGFVYDGRYSASRERHVGAPLPADVPSSRLIGCVQNHDQIGNRAAGDRLTTLIDADLVRVATVLLLAAPHTPLLFMGEEYGETNPFCYFTSHPEPQLAEAVRTGRAEEFAGFAAFAGEVPDPQDPETFARSKLDWSRADTEAGRQRLALHRDLLRLRRAVPALATSDRRNTRIVHADASSLLVARHHSEPPVVLLAVNLIGAERHHALPEGWSVRDTLLGSEDEAYGGAGRRAEIVDGPPRLAVPPRTATLLNVDMDWAGSVVGGRSIPR